MNIMPIQDKCDAMFHELGGELSPQLLQKWFTLAPMTFVSIGDPSTNGCSRYFMKRSMMCVYYTFSFYNSSFTWRKLSIENSTSITIFFLNLIHKCWQMISHTLMSASITCFYIFYVFFFKRKIVKEFHPTFLPNN